MKIKSGNKNLIFRLMCILLIVTSFTCIALAKYISSRQDVANAEIGSFRCSISVQLDENDTMIPFFNTQYIINDVVMSYPQSTNFLVNNCDLNADGTYSEPATVDLKYDLIFYIPKEFAKLSAVQIAKKNEKNEDVAVTQLYELEKFINNTANITANGSFSTTIKDDSEKEVIVDYGSLVYPEDETFTLSEGGSIKHWDGDKDTSISIETVSKPAKLQYVFPVYDRKPDKKSPAVVSYPPLYVNREVTLEFYSIRISRPEFVIEGGERRDHNYILRTTTKRQMNDEPNQQDAPFGINSYDFFDGYSNGSSIKWQNKDCTVTLVKTVEDENREKIATWTLDLDNGKNPQKPPSVGGVVYEGYYIATFTQKNYPIRLNAVFTQTKIQQTQTETSGSAV